MYYIGMDVHKKTISHCVKDAAGPVHQEGKIGTTRLDLDASIRTLPHPPRNRITLPPLLARLHGAGIPQDVVTILIATGLHRQATADELNAILGPEIAASYRIGN